MKRNFNQIVAGVFALLFLSIITSGARFEQLKVFLGSYEPGVFLFGVVGTWYVIGKSFDIFIEKQTFVTALITLLCGGVWGLTFIGVSVFLVPFIVMGMFVCILWSFKNKWSREDKVAYSAVLYLCILLYAGIGYGLNWLGELIEAEKESKISFSQPVQLREGDTVRAVVVDGKLQILDKISRPANIAVGIPTQKGMIMLK